VKGKATGVGKGKWTGYGKGNGIGKQTPGGDDVAHAIAVWLQEELYEADSDRGNSLEWVYLELEASPAGSLSSDDDTDSTELDG